MFGRRLSGRLNSANIWVRRRRNRWHSPCWHFPPTKTHIYRPSQCGVSVSIKPAWNQWANSHKHNGKPGQVIGTISLGQKIKKIHFRGFIYINLFVVKIFWINWIIIHLIYNTDFFIYLFQPIKPCPLKYFSLHNTFIALRGTAKKRRNQTVPSKKEAKNMKEQTKL